MKRKILSLILAFAMTVSLFTVGTGAVKPTYGDIAGHWAEDSIERWSGHGIIQGSNGLFDPNGQLTCAQLATILAKLLKLPVAKDAGFTDNKADAWYYDAINRCAGAGILNGNGDGTVGPNATISRERAIVMLARALGIEPIENPDLTKYGDAAKVSAYAQGMVAAMIEAGIVGGVTADELAPRDNINRASTVTILDRAIAVYADRDGETIDASKANGLILIAAKNVTVKNAPKGTSVLVCKNASGATVNGKAVDAGTSVTAEKAQPAKPTTGGGSSGGSSGGATPNPSNLTVAEAKTVSGGTYQNVTITDAVGNGEVTLTGLTIHGDLTVKGGGSSSIKLIDCIILGRIIMDKLISEGAQQPRLELTKTPVKAVEVRRPAILESADAASGIEAVTALADITVQGTHTKIDKMDVPASAAQPVDLVVNGAKILQISTNKETSISGDGKVDTVVAEAPVNVDSATVDKVEVPASAKDVVINVTGSTEIVIKADSGSTKIAADNTGKITVNGNAEGSITLHAHRWNEGVVTKQRTCSEEGVMTYTCTAEGCPAKTKTESVAKIPHTEVVDAAVAANCLTAGKTDGKHCSVCSTVIVAQEEIKPLGHDFAVAQHDAAQHWLKCSRCDAVNAKMDHSYNAHSCDTAAKCIGCDYEKPAGTHSWNSGVVTTPATTTSTGVKTYTCTVCDATKTETIPATGESTVAPAKGISSIKQQGICLVVSMTAPESMEHIDYFTFSFYDSTHEAESLMTGITCTKDKPNFYVEASKFDPKFNYDKAKITAIAKAGYANTAWTGNIKISMNTVALDYQVTSEEEWWGIDFTKSAPGFFKVEHFASGSDETKPDKESYSLTDESDSYQFISAAFDGVTPTDGGTVKLTLGWNPVITETADGWELDVTLYTPGTRTTHEHTYSTNWSYDADYHWHAATCGHTMVSGKSEHTWNNDTCSACSTTKTADKKNGYDIAWTVGSGALNARLTAPGVEDLSVKFTIYLYNAETGEHSSYSNRRGDGKFDLPLSVAAGEYDRVRVYRPISGDDYSEATPLADWALEKKVIASENKIKFPHNAGTIIVTVQENEGSGAPYKYTFTGLDFTKYSYILTNPSANSSLTLTAKIAYGAETWIGTGMKLAARTVEETAKAYTIFTSESYSIDIAQPDNKTSLLPSSIKLGHSNSEGLTLQMTKSTAADKIKGMYSLHYEIACVNQTNTYDRGLNPTTVSTDFITDYSKLFAGANTVKVTFKATPTDEAKTAGYVEENTTFIATVNYTVENETTYDKTVAACITTSENGKKTLTVTDMLPL